MCLENHSEETIAKISEANKGKKHSEETKAKMSASKGQRIEVTDLVTKISNSYVSVCTAARALNIHPKIISQYFTKKNKKTL